MLKEILGCHGHRTPGQTCDARERNADRCFTHTENSCRIELPGRQKNARRASLWWPEAESNRRHADFQSAALPTELSGHFSGVRTISTFTRICKIRRALIRTPPPACCSVKLPIMSQSLPRKRVFALFRDTDKYYDIRLIVFDTTIAIPCRPRLRNVLGSYRSPKP